jgi:hypothetical protein
VFSANCCICIDMDNIAENHGGQMILILFCVAVFIYLPSLWNDYIIDDFSVFMTSGKRPDNNLVRFWRQLMGDGYWNDKTKKG